MFGPPENNGVRADFFPVQIASLGQCIELIVSGTSNYPEFIGYLACSAWLAIGEEF
jgi:hypothetical protein